MRRLLILLALAIPAWGQITKDAATSGTITGDQSALSWNHTTGSLTNGVLIVGVVYYPSSVSITVSSITYNSVALTKIIRTNNGVQGATTDIWYLAAPASGTHSIAVTLSATLGNSNGIMGNAITIYNAASTPEVSTSAGSVVTGSHTTHSDNITTLAANAWAIDEQSYATGTTPSFVANGSQASQTTTSQGNIEGSAMSTLLIASPGSSSVGWAFATTGGAATAHSIVSFAPSATMAAPTYIPLGQSSWGVLMTGTGTSWTPGTPGTPTFSVSGVSGVSLASQQVLTSTTALLTLTTGNVTGTLTISDGTISTTSTVVSPGLNTSWGGTWRYADTGVPTDGDSWFIMDTVNGLRATCADCTGINSSNNSNVAFFTETSDLSTIVLKNAMTGLGTKATAVGGLCASSLNMKQSAFFTYNGLYVMGLQCMNSRPFTSTQASFILSTSTDDGAHWARVQDTYAVSAGSWAAGTVTLTTASQSFSAGDLVIVMGCTPAAYNSIPAMATVLAGGDSTHVKYTLANPGAYVSGCVVIGPATTTVTLPSGTAMWVSGRMIRRQFAQICTDNVSCSATPDSTDTYLVGVGTAGDATAQDPVTFRILKTDFDLTPGDVTKYTYWTGSAWTSTLANAINPTCIVEGVSAACYAVGGNLWYITDSLLPDGGQYVMMRGSSQFNGRVSFWDQQEIFVASHVYGPWTLAGTSTVDAGRAPPTAYNFPNSSPSQYTRLSASPYVGKLCFQLGGSYFSDYGVYHRCIELTLRTVNDSPLFNAAINPGYAGSGTKYHHVTSGLVALWRMRPYRDAYTLKDDSITGGNLTMSTQIATSPTSAMVSETGLRNADSSLNATWETVGGAWNIPTTFTQATLGSGDFSTLAVFASTASGTQYLLSGTTTGTVGFAWKIVGTALHFTVRNASSIDVTCPGTLVAGTFVAYIGVRSGTTGYCFALGTAAPVSGGTDSASLGTYTLQIGSPFGVSATYFNGTIGTLAIWNRALCSSQISGTCSAGQTDEVLREFAAVKFESRSRGWGF